jgi:hypothetical protein
VFAFGMPRPKDLTRSITSIKTARTEVRKKAGEGPVALRMAWNSLASLSGRRMAFRATNVPVG